MATLGIFRTALLSVMLKCGTAALMLAVAALLANVMGPEKYGIYALAATIAIVAGTPLSFGLSTLAMRVASKARDASPSPPLRTFLRYASLAILALAAASLALASAAAWLPATAARPELGVTLVVAALLVPTLALTETSGAIQRAHGSPLLGQVPDQLLRYGFCLVLLAGMLGVGGRQGLSPPLAMGALVAGSVLASIVSLGLLYRSTRSFPASGRHADAADWNRSLLPLALVAGIQALGQNIDLFILGALDTSSSIGIYRISAQCASLVTFHLSAVAAILAPRITRAHAKNDFGVIQREVSRTAAGTLLASIPAALVLIAFGDGILASAFGEAYRAGAPALAVLAFAQVINAATGPVGVVMSLLGQERRALVCVALGAVTTALLTTLLVPRYGTLGAAFGAAAGISLWNAAMVSLLYRHTGIVSLPIGVRS